MTADWFTALNAPKGLRSFGGTLWVADLDEVIGIDVASAKENARVKIDGANSSTTSRSAPTAPSTCPT